MGLKKNKAGVWCYDFRSAGKRYRGSTKLTNKKEAEKHFKELVASIRGEQSSEMLVRRIKNHGGVKITLDEAFKEFCHIPRKQRISEAQTNIHRSNWNDFICFVKDNFPKVEYVSEVEASHARKYIQHLRDNGRWNKTVTYKPKGRHTAITHTAKNKSLSTATLNKFLQTCRMVFAGLYIDHDHIENPFDKIPKLKNEKVAREAFSPEELKLIGEKAKDEWFYPVFLVGISTGLRLGDICLLEWKNINPKTGWIENLVMRKTGKAISIPMITGLLNYIKELPQENEYVFPRLAGQYKRNSSLISKKIRLFLEDMGIKSSHKAENRYRAVSVKGAHSLRHTFAYLAGVHGLPLPIVQSILGHMSPEMTKLYSDHATEQDKQLHLQRLPDYLSIEASKQEMSLRELIESITPENALEVKAKLLELI